jgi:erythromycin esterase-like protein
MRDLPKLKINLQTPEAFGNVAEKLREDERRTLADDLMQLINVDETSMSDWLGKAKGYLDEVEAETSQQPKSNEEQSSAGEKDPPSTEMTLAAVIQFAARATGACLASPT